MGEASGQSSCCSRSPISSQIDRLVLWSMAILSVTRRWGSISRASQFDPTSTKGSEPENVSRPSACLLGKTAFARPTDIRLSDIE
jgi:hypothetical protein